MKDDRGFRDANDLWKLSFFPQSISDLPFNTSDSFSPYSHTVSCPNINIVDPQNDGFPKVDASGNSISLDILPPTTSITRNSFIIIHALVMFLAMGILYPLGALFMHFSIKSPKVVYIHGITQSFVIMLTIGIYFP